MLQKFDSFVLVVVFFLLPFSLINARQTMLFQPSGKENWHVYTANGGANNDPLQVFRFGENTIHVSGEDFGYLVTEKK